MQEVQSQERSQIVLGQHEITQIECYHLRLRDGRTCKGSDWGYIATVDGWTANHISDGLGYVVEGHIRACGCLHGAQNCWREDSRGRK